MRAHFFFNMGNAIQLCPVTEAPFDVKYEVDESQTIGTGKFSEVFLCWRRNNPLKRYALKVITTRTDDQASLTRIVEEINILQVIGDHPSIIQLIDRDESQPLRMRFVLELCEGGELYDRVQQRSYYPEADAKILIRNLLEACCYIHGKGIMHRDLKPENILLVSKMSNTEIKISDFGLAKISKDYPRKLPRSHSICGSDFYLAPEVIKQEEYGREIDIWSVGVITYVIMSGSLPFFHTVLHKLYRQIVERDLVFPDKVWGKVSKGAQDFILRLLQVRPGDRLTSEQAMNHPWLRGASSPIGSFSMNSSAFESDMRKGMTNCYTDHQDPRIGNTVNPLEQAHKMIRPDANNNHYHSHPY